MPYASTTLAGATQEIANRLGDPLFVRFTQAELSVYLSEALRCWNSLTGHFRDQDIFPTVAGTPFYDLSSVLQNGTRSYSVTDRDLVTSLEYTLLEPATPTSWTGTSMFTLADLTTALQRRRDQFLLETGMVLTRTTQVVGPTMGGRFPFSENVITVRRVAFKNSDNEVTPLHREDVWAFSHFSSRFPQQAGRPPVAPAGYSVGETPPLVMQIVPPLSDAGTLDLITVQRGATLDPSVGVLLGVPDDFAYVVKYGALADLLSKDGLASDPSRARYAEQRWQAGLDAAKRASVVWAARVNNVPIEVASLTEADQYQVTWQTGTGVPTTALLAGGNLLGLYRVPNAGPYSVTVDLVRNAPIPSALTDYLQVGNELLDLLYGYCVHLAVLKEGSAEAQASQNLLENFYSAAGVSLKLDAASTPNLPLLTDQTERDERQTQRMVEAT